MPITVPTPTVETFTSSQASTQTLDLSDAAIDDVRVVAINHSPDGTANIGNITIPTGWTEIGSNTDTGAASDSKLSLIYRVVQSGDTLTGGTLQVTTSTSMTVGSIATTYRGVDTTNVLDQTTPAMNASSGSPVCPTITTVTDNAWVVHAAIQDATSGSFTDGSIPSGDTLRGTMANNPPSNGMNLGLSDNEQATAGASGTATYQNSTSEENVGATFALRPIVGPFITSVDGDDDIDAGQQNVVVAGGAFGATDTGSADFEIGDSATYGTATLVSCPRDSWSATSIQVDIPSTIVDTLGVGTRWAYVTDSAGAVSPAFPIALHRAHELRMSASANIAASGENTTARLTAPLGKTTGDFGGGRIQDDENPGDAVDLLIDEYREDVWSIESIAGTEGLAFDLRVVLADGSVLNLYTATPVLTISSGFTGTISMGLPFMDLAVVAEEIFEATADPTVPFVDLDATGTETFQGTADPTVPFVDIAATGQWGYTGTTAMNLPFVDLATAAALIFPGQASPVLPFVDLALSGTLTVPGSVAITLPFVDLAAVAQQILQGQAAPTVPFVDLAALAEQVFAGQADPTLPFIDLAIVASQDIPVVASVAMTLPFMDLAAAALQTFQGQAAPTLPFVDLAAAAITVDTLGNVSMTVPFVDLAAVAQQIIAGQADPTLPFVDLAAAGVQSFQGQAALTMPFVDLAAGGFVTNFLGPISFAVPFVDLALTGTNIFTAAGPVVFQAPFVDLAVGGTQTLIGQGALTLPFVDLTIIGVTPDIYGPAALDLPFMEIAALAEQVFAGTAALPMPFVDLALTGTVVIPGTVAPSLPFIDISVLGFQGLNLFLGPVAMSLPFVNLSVLGVTPTPGPAILVPATLGAMGLPVQVQDLTVTVPLEGEDAPIMIIRTPKGIA